MKKTLIIILFFMLSLSIITPDSIKKVEASSNTFGLITTIYDDEDNGSFQNAVLVEDVSITSPHHSSDYIGGTLSTSSDLDYFCFKVMYSAQIVLRLSMYDESMNSIYNYNFSVYKRLNQNAYSISTNNYELLYSSSNLITDEAYSFVSDATCYYVKIFNGSISYSSRMSYKLEYSITPTSRTNHNLYQDAIQSYETGGYAIWISDFAFNNRRNRVPTPQENQIHYATNFNYYPIAEDYLFDGYGFPTFELYFWGIEYRELFVSYLNLAIEEIEKKDDKLAIVEGVRTYLDYVNETMLLVLSFGNNEMIEMDIDFTYYGIVSKLLQFIFQTWNRQTYLELIEYYEYLIDCIEDKDGDLDNQDIFVITYKQYLLNIDVQSPNYYLRGNFDNSGCRYITHMKYNNSYIYDIKQYDHNNDGVYNNIYGKFYLNNPIERLNEFFQ